LYITFEGEEGEMKRNLFFKSNSAVAGVVEAILLIGLVAVILSVIQVVYVPEIMEQKESDHMDQVMNQFANLKSVIEVQSMMGTLGTSEAITYTPMASPITLGSRELPYLVSARSFGYLTLTDQNDANGRRINIQPAPADFPTGIPLTSINYEAENAYFVHQTYILEGGGIILEQYNGEVMRVNPAIGVENYSDAGFIQINYFIPFFTGATGRKSTGGIQDAYVHTNYTADYSHSGSAAFIHIYTDYPNAWYQAFVNESRGLLTEYADNGYLTVQIEDSTDPDRVEIVPNSKNIELELTIVELKVQVGPGYAVE
jgi:hypothetical protein